jgi:fumarate reductase flavoprotein subunit
MEWDLHADVVVVGGGGAGLMVAITAATFRGGVDVLLLEKDSRVAPNSAIGGGMLQAAGTRFQRAAGIADTPELMAADIVRKNRGQSEPALTLSLCRRSADVVHWFADDLGVPIELAPETHWLGHSRPRMHAHPRRSGAPLVDALRARMAGLSNLTYADGTPGCGLVTGEGGTVIGVFARRQGRSQLVRAERVVLVTGGFGANREMLSHYIPEVVDVPYLGTATNTGEGIQWGVEAGGAADHMSGYQGLGFAVPGTGTRLNPGLISAGGIMVDTAGRRFEREDQGYSEWAGVLLRQPGRVAVAVWDEEIHRPIERTTTMVDSTRAGAIVMCRDIDEVARHFKLDSGTLARTVTEYNRAVAAGRDPLGREVLVHQLTPPFFAAWVTGALAHTQGGLRIDAVGRVLRADGSPVRNLYAGGGTAAGLSGGTPDGYTSGNGLLVAYTLGRIIGEHVVSSLLA